ncbi:hypothetical protein SNE40_004107 [Patella caerulea]|uniref:RNA-directed DNA polymerase n=1 Tax=Patella caerulea TaxID=87958 RepID=A0AAN8KCZ7_PATCE
MAVSLDNVGELPIFDCLESAGLAARWKRWLRAFELFVVGKGVTDPGQKKALLLHRAGMNLQDIYFTLPEVQGEGDVYAKTVRTLNRHFIPQTNVPFERHLFRSMSQLPTETIEQFITRLRQHSESCQFGDLGAVNERIRDHVIDKCCSSQLRRKLLERGTDLTLSQLRETARVFEETERQMASIDGIKSEIQKLTVSGNGNKGQGHDNPYRENYHYDRGKSNKFRCYSCGYEGHTLKDPKCPARGQRCRKCKGVGHFESCCKTKQFKSSGRSNRGRNYGNYRRKSSRSQTDLKQIRENDNDADYAFHISRNETCDAEIELSIGGVPLRMYIDSGASVNVIDKKTWKYLKAENVECVSKKESKNIFPYGSNETLPIAGTFRAQISQGEFEIQDVEFIVIEGEGQALLGKKTALELDVLRLGPRINAVQTDTAGLKAEYEDCFKGFGKLKDFQLTIPINREETPVISSLRRVPYHLRDRLEKKLDELENLDIIEKVDSPSAWVSPVVVVPKGQNDIRLCVDMRLPNKAVQSIRHPIPTIDEVLQDMNQSNIFSRLDIKWAYHQIELAPESREITTFITHKGLYRYKRLMFGISCAPEMYQKVLQQILQSCEGTENIMVDIIVHAKSDEEHDRRLKKVLDVIRSKGMTLNPEKCLFKLPKLKFMGHVLSAKGLAPADVKVKAITETREPTTASEVRSFLGLVNYTGRFIENLATISEPLRRLTRKEEKFVWGTEQRDAFNELKERMKKAETLAYFDKTAKTLVIADASPVGLGAVLVQKQNGENRVISYASKSLSDVERRYSQTEKEALGLVWACERFHPYIYGTDFELLTDHKPLEFIYSTKSKPSARIERWVLRMQPYKYIVKHIPGKNNIADCLSRLLKTDGPMSSSIDTEEYIKFVALASTPNALTTKEIEIASGKDPELENIRQCLMTGRWHDTNYKQYVPIRNELSSIGKLVLRRTRIIVPTSLREQILKLAHEGHPGIVSMKQRIRTKVWWPGMDREAEKYCRTCHGCQLVSQPTPPTPMSRTELPSSPWEHLAADLLGPLPSGENIFVVVDYYSRYFELRIMKNTTTERIVTMLEEIFLTHGLPVSLQTDNGPQFVSDHFNKYMEETGIQHRKTTPLWPQANGEVERQNRSILKRIKIAQAEKRDWKHELNHFLMMFRSTPHSTTGKSPSELLFRRIIRTKIPEISQFNLEDTEVRDKDSEQKGKGKEYSDQRRNARENDLQAGDSVLMKQSYVNKWSTPFAPNPFIVKERKGNSVVIESSEGVQYKRNLTAVKKFMQKDSVNSESVNVSNVDVPIPFNSQSENDNSDVISRQIDLNQSEYDLHIPETNTNKTDNSPRPVRQKKKPARFNDFEIGHLALF